MCIYIYIYTYDTLLDLCVSSLHRDHAILHCFVPILTDDPRRESSQGRKIARRKSTPQKSSRISSGIFQWMFSGISQRIVIFSQWIFTGIVQWIFSGVFQQIFTNNNYYYNYNNSTNTKTDINK